MCSSGSARPVTLTFMKGAAALVLTILAATSGCSWFFVQPPHSGVEFAPKAVRTTSRAAPVADTLFAAGTLATTMYINSQENYGGQRLTVVAGATTATLFLVSMIYGYWDTSECEDATRSLPGPPLRGRPTGQLQVTHRPIPAVVAPAPAAASEEEPGEGDPQPAAPAAPVTPQ